MTATEPKVDVRGWYELKAAAAILEVSKSTLTRAMNSTDRNRSIPFKIRKSNGRRIISGQALVNYWRIAY